MSKALLKDPLGFARLNHQFVTADTSFMTGHSLFISGVPTQDSIDSLCALASDVFEAHLLAHLAQETTYTNAQLILSTGTSEMVGTSTIDHAGLISGKVASLSLAVVASMRTGDHYRGGHGRSYFGGFTDDRTESDRLWNGAFIGDFETSWAAYLAGVAGLSQDALVVEFNGVVHRFSGKVELDPHTISPMVGSKVQRRICSQRRRLGRLI